MRIVKILSLIIVCSVVLTACQPKEKPIENVTLNYWSVYEPQENIDELINEFQSKNPNIKINYTRKGLKEYKQQLLARAGQENGPDIFRFHNSWVPELKSILAVVPQSIVDELKYNQTFYPVAQKDLKFGKSYLGIPLMYDGLGLYYNKTLFEQAAIDRPPADWDKVMEAALKLRATNQGKLEIAGLAIGSTENVDYWSDILALLMEQNSANQLNPNATPDQTQLVIEYFRRGLIGQTQVWDNQMVNSTEAFAQGKAAMIFGTSWTAFEIQAKNPNLQFAVAPVPQLPGSEITIANYWIEGVTRTALQSKNQAAWQFLNFLAQKENQQRLYAIQGKSRLFGEPASRTDLATEIISNHYIGSIIKTAPNARSTYLSDKTFGGGLNDEIQEIYKKLIKGEESIESATPKLKDLTKKYAIQ